VPWQGTQGHIRELLPFNIQALQTCYKPRKCIYRNRKYATGPSIEALEELLVDELDRKYGKEKWKKYEEHPSEFMAISWLRMKKGWNHIKPTWLPLI